MRPCRSLAPTYIIAVVRYRDGKIFVRWVMSHREYDNWCKLHRKGKAFP